MFSNGMVCDIINYIVNNINKDITIDEIASFCFFNKTYVMKKFKKELGLSIFDFINRMRIYNSLSFYQSDNYILSIAFNNGFNSLEYYSEIFKKTMGVSPRVYKRYVWHSKGIKESEISIILNSINNLIDLKNRYIKYLNNRKPKMKMVKVRTIFK